MNFKSWFQDEDFFNLYIFEGLEDKKELVNKFVDDENSADTVKSYLKDFDKIRNAKYKEIWDQDLDLSIPELGLSDIPRDPKGARLDITNYKKLAQIQKLKYFIAAKRAPKPKAVAVDSESKSEFKPVFENDEVIIWYAKDADECIQAKYTEPAASENVPNWCVSRSTPGSNLYNMYRYRPSYHEPSFYFVRKKPRSEKPVGMSGPEAWNFHVIQINKLGGYVKTPYPNGDHACSWNGILETAPELKDLKHIFVNYPLSNEEKTFFQVFENKEPSLEEFKEMPFKLQELYIDIFGVKRPLNVTYFKLLPEELKNKYVGFNRILTADIVASISENQKLIKRYRVILQRCLMKKDNFSDKENAKIVADDLEFFKDELPLLNSVAFNLVFQALPNKEEMLKYADEKALKNLNSASKLSWLESVGFEKSLEDENYHKLFLSLQDEDKYKFIQKTGLKKVVQAFGVEKLIANVQSWDTVLKEQDINVIMDLLPKSVTEKLKYTTWMSIYLASDEAGAERIREYYGQNVISNLTNDQRASPVNVINTYFAINPKRFAMSTDSNFYNTITATDLKSIFSKLPAGDVSSEFVDVYLSKVSNMQDEVAGILVSRHKDKKQAAANIVAQTGERLNAENLHEILMALDDVSQYEEIISLVKDNLPQFNSRHLAQQIQKFGPEEIFKHLGQEIFDLLGTHSEKEVQKHGPSKEYLISLLQDLGAKETGENPRLLQLLRRHRNPFAVQPIDRWLRVSKQKTQMIDEIINRGMPLDRKHVIELLKNASNPNEVAKKLGENIKKLAKPGADYVDDFTMLIFANSPNIPELAKMIGDDVSKTYTEQLIDFIKENAEELETLKSGQKIIKSAKELAQLYGLPQDF